MADLTGRISTDGFLLADSPKLSCHTRSIVSNRTVLGQTGEVTENSSRSVVSSSVDELPRFSGASRPILIDQREAMLQRSVFIAA